MTLYRKLYCITAFWTCYMIPTYLFSLPYQFMQVVIWKKLFPPADGSYKWIIMHEKCGRPDKGQWISKCPFGVIVWTKIPTKKNPGFLPYSKKRSNQKNGGFYFDSFTPIFWFDLFLEARAEIREKNSWYFGPNDDTKRTFWN